MLHSLRNSERSPITNDGLVQAFIEKFVPKFVPGGELVYARSSNPSINKALMKELGIVIGSHLNMPDAMVYCRKRNWLFVVESATGNGLIDEKHVQKLVRQFNTASPGLVFVSVLKNRSALTKYPSFPAWKTDVWFADEPDHMMHFD